MGVITTLSNSLKPFYRLLVAAIVLTSFILVPIQRSASAAGTECSSSSPVSAAYMVTVCIVDPLDSEVLSGNATVTASDGTYNFALTTTSGTAFSLASRESGANAPQLIVEVVP